MCKPRQLLIRRVVVAVLSLSCAIEAMFGFFLRDWFEAEDSKTAAVTRGFTVETIEDEESQIYENPAEQSGW